MQAKMGTSTDVGEGLVQRQDCGQQMGDVILALTLGWQTCRDFWVIPVGVMEKS